MSSPAAQALSLKRPRRILYVYANGALGGGERVTTLMVKHHDPQRFAAVALFLADGPLPKQLAAEGFQTYTLPTRLRLRDPFSVLRAQTFISQVLQQESIGLVHACMPYSQILAWLPAQRRRIPLVVFQHGPIGGRIDRLASALPTALVLTNSQYTKNKFERFSLRQEPVSVLPLATDLHIPAAAEAALRTSVERELGLTDGHFVITMLARLAPGKGLDFAIASLAPILRDAPHLRLVLVGGPFREFFPHYQQDLAKLANTLGVTAQVVFTGFKEDIRPYLARSDLVLSASEEEAFGLTLIEGMAAGRPVLASRVGGAAEVMTDGVDGRYFAAFDAAGLQKAVSELIGDATLRASLAAEGRRRVDRDYRPEVMMQRLEGYYDQVLASY